MKRTLISCCVSLAALASIWVFGQPATAPIPIYKWTAIVKVAGEDENPVSGAEVAVSYTLPIPFGRNPEEGADWSEVKGLTDSNGVFTASHTDSSWGLGINIEKTGYYTTHIGHQLYVPGQFDEKTVTASRNPTVNLVLKKVGKPVAMYAKRLNTHVPALDKPVGFDLMAGDWVGPYGKGMDSDVLFTGHFDKHQDGESDFTLTVSFSKPGDGIQEFTVPDIEKGCGLRSPHEAPSGGYQPQWVQTDNRKPGRPIETNRNEERNYFFRVRTKLDENGNVVSAHYGKIYGDFMKFSYYLNPTINDPNIEFDPKQNLLGGLKSFEQVGSP